MELFNICSAKVETLLIWIVNKDDLARLLKSPLKSVNYIRQTLEKFFTGLDLTDEEASKLRKMIADKFKIRG